MININNYEVYMLDYLEGNLSLEEKEAVRAFLEVNPMIKDEVSDLMNFSLMVTEEAVYEGKEDLKKRNGGYLKYVSILLLCVGFTIVYVMQNNQKTSIPNNKIQEYKAPLKTGKVEGEILAELPIDKINVMPSQKNVDAIESNTITQNEVLSVERNKNKLTQNKTKQITSKIKEEFGNSIEEQVEESTQIIFAANTEKKIKEVSLTNRRPNVVLASLETKTLKLDPIGLEAVDMNTLANSASLPKSNDPTLAVSINLGPFSKAKRKIQSFLENESVTAVREAVTPEYFAKN